MAANGDNTVNSGRRNISRSRTFFAALVLALFVFVLDQGAKEIVEREMSLGQSIPIVQNVLHLTYIENTGGAFGILANQGFILLAGSLVAVVFVFWLLLSGKPSRLTVAGCGLILGGAAGNLLDRLTSSGVTDYLDLRVWPIFNAADIAITLGVVLLLLASLRPQKP